jgi:hypothetical protein
LFTFVAADARGAFRAAVFARVPLKTLALLQLAAQSPLLWLFVRGFAVPMLDGRLDGTIKALPGREDAETLLEAVLMKTRVGD